ncbi:hypothetical protein NDU88_001905 [Pleurodeles waltl]|uniref:Uncharacterized protein n=1 Tax=Pleurodeles waltl TaxID=8319 RepID=A0AAV7Q516_PLEWA|nr:hypothetical protein NDU88_001905 [Pleurodeles waltl]
MTSGLKHARYHLLQQAPKYKHRLAHLRVHDGWWGAKTGHQLKLDKFTRPRETTGTQRPEEQKAETGAMNPEDNTISPKDIMAAIQGVRRALKSKIDTVVLEVMLIRVDSHNLRARVKEAEGSLKEIKDDFATLMAQVLELGATTASLEDKPKAKEEERKYPE